MKEHNLRLCPWCKQPPKLEQDCDLTWYVSCSFRGCAVSPITAPYQFKRQAVMVWNCCEKPDVMPKPVTKK